MSLSRTIKKDPRYKKAARIMSRIESDFDTDKVNRELMSLHASRSITSMRAKEVTRNSVKTMISSSLEEAGVRSRCTTIKMQCLRHLTSLETSIEHLRKYLLIKYSDKMQGSTLTANKAEVDMHLQEFFRVKDNLTTTDKMASLVIDDCDSAGWSLKRIEDALERSSKDR